MLKNSVLLGLFLMGSRLLATVDIVVYKNMSFSPLNLIGRREYAVGEGILEVRSDEEDIGKVVSLKFYDKMEITNGKNIINIEKLTLDKKVKHIVIEKKISHIKFYGIIDRKNLADKNILPEVVEGAYSGETPIIYSVYKRGDSIGDIPTVLPELSDENREIYEKTNPKNKRRW